MPLFTYLCENNNHHHGIETDKQKKNPKCKFCKKIMKETQTKSWKKDEFLDIKK
jgi:hypothetical protein